MNISAKSKLSLTRLKVLTAVLVMTHVLWDMTLCGCSSNPDFLREPYSSGPSSPVRAVWSFKT